MKIFHRYAKQKVLRPIKGDLINELQLYNTMGTFGTMVNDPKKADICYVRANPDVFRKCPSPKIYFGVPYHHLSFKRADAIAVFSDEWKRRLLAGEEVAGNPGYKPKKVIVIDQPVAPMFKPLQDHPKTKAFRKQMGGGFIIGHFGKMRHNRTPPPCRSRVIARMINTHPKMTPEVISFYKNNFSFEQCKTKFWVKK